MALEGDPGEPALRVPLRGAPGDGARRRGLRAQRRRPRVAPVVLPLGARGPTTSCCALAEAGRLSTPGGARAAGAAHARRSALRRAGDALRGAVAAAAGPRQDQPRRAASIPDFDEQLEDVDAARDRAVLPTTRARGPAACSICSPPTTRSSNERLARHYGIPDVVGDRVPARCAYPDDRRRGLLGHGSILTLTSHADRTSPVLRGKWVMEVLLGTPPPPPPPDVPDLEATAEAEDGRLLHGARAHGAAPREPGVHVVPPVDRSDRPGARQLRRHRRVAHQGQRHAGRHARARSTTARR